MLFVPEEEVPFPEGAWGGGWHDARDAGPLAHGWDERLRECGAYRVLEPSWELLRAQERHGDGTLTSAAEAYRSSRPAGTDFRACPYLGRHGCRLPRESRPPSAPASPATGSGRPGVR